MYKSIFPSLLVVMLLALPAVVPVLAQSENAPFEIEETGHSFWRLDDAVAELGAKPATINIQPGTYRDCAVFEDRDITLRADRPGSVIFDGTACEGKAALVFRGKNAVVDGIIFQNMAVPDGNGAGIRLERGHLRVVNAVFRNSQQGILTAPDLKSAIVIDHSTFSRLGRCDGGNACAHSLYVGDYGSLTVTNSRFEKGTGGHYLKSNAGRNNIADNSFDDSQGVATNYMIDLPSGSVGSITGNMFVQGKNKENHSAFIAIAAENRSHRSGGLVIADNKASLAPNVPWSTWFVADWSHEPLRIGQNTLAQGIGVKQLR